MNAKEWNKTAELRRLLWRIRDGVATAEEVARLEQLVSEDPALRRFYVRYSYLCGNLQWINAGGSQAEADEKLAELLAEAAETEAFPSPIEDDIGSPVEKPPRPAPARRRPRRRSRRVTVLSMSIAAAAAAVVAFLSLAPWMLDSPLPVAAVERTINGGWQSKAYAPGDGLVPGERIRLLDGFVEVSFESGARVILEAPADFEIIDRNRARLRRGTAFAHVPQSGRGFRIDAPEGAVIDLGTEFGLEVEPDGRAEVHVFDGEVDAETGQTHKKVRVKQGSAVAVRRSELNEVSFAPKKFQAIQSAAKSDVSTSGNVRFLTEAPPSATLSGFEHNRRVHVFVENKLLLKEPLTVDVTRTGSYNGANVISRGQNANRRENIAAGKVVRSYLLHFDPVYPGERVKGEIRFQRPVVGIVWSAPNLAATDELLGVEGLPYDKSPCRVFEGRDWVTLSPDRKTLSIHCYATKCLDQLRVLVSEDEK